MELITNEVWISICVVHNSSNIIVCIGVGVYVCESVCCIDRDSEFSLDGGSFCCKKERKRARKGARVLALCESGVVYLAYMAKKRTKYMYLYKNWELISKRIHWDWHVQHLKLLKQWLQQQHSVTNPINATYRYSVNNTERRRRNTSDSAK